MIKLTLARIALTATLGLSLAACEDDDGPATTDARPGDGGATDATDATTTTDTTTTDAGGDRTDATTSDSGGDTATTDAGGGDATTAEKVARGKYLVDVVASCGECHTPRLPPMGTPDPNNYLAGDNTPSPNCTFRNPANNECIYPRNLTNDATGLKNRTDAEIKNMFLNGKRPVPPGGDAGATEEALHPIMPYYSFKNMSDADADAIVAYLRTVPAKERTIPRRGASFDVPAPAPPVTLAKIPTPRAEYPFKEAAMRGRYLAGQVGLCMECHTTKLPPGPTSPSVLDENKLFQGGESFTGILGPTVIITSKNLTSDVATGLGSWSFEQVAAAIKDGKDKDGKGICPPMPSGMAGYGNLTETDLSDITHYIRSLPAAANAVADMCTFPPM